MDLKIVCHSKKPENPHPVQLELQVQRDRTLQDVRQHLCNLNFMSLEKCKFKMPGEGSAINTRTAIGDINMHPLQLQCYTASTNSRDKQTQSQLDVVPDRTIQLPVIITNTQEVARALETIEQPIQTQPQQPPITHQTPQIRPPSPITIQQPPNSQDQNETSAIHLVQQPKARVYPQNVNVNVIQPKQEEKTCPCCSVM